MDEKIILTGEDGEKLELYILEETRIGGMDYILASDVESGDGNCYILKDKSDSADTEAVYEIVEDENGGVVKRRETQKYEPPNITAIKLWLSRRLPEKWGARVGEVDAQDKLNALLAALDAQAGGEEAP